MPMYSRDSLLSFSAASPIIPRTTRKQLFLLQLWSPRFSREMTSERLHKLRSTSSKKQSGPLKVGLLNTRSATNKGPLVQDDIHGENLDIFIIVESWIPSDAPNSILHSLSPDGFSTIHQHRGTSKDKRGGGVAIVHRDGLKSTILENHVTPEFESLIVKFNNKTSSFIISSLYRPPGPITSNFIKTFEEMLDVVSAHSVPFIICGDFNAPGSHGGLHHLLETSFVTNELTQHVTSPTHSQGHILDLLITSARFGGLLSDVAVRDSIYSDHHLITCNISINKPSPSAATVYRRHLKRVDWGKFEQDLSVAVDGLCSSVADVDTFTSQIHTQLTGLLDVHAPLRRISLRAGPNSNKLLSKEAIQAKRTCRQCERQYLRLRTDEARNTYKAAKESARRAIIDSKAVSIREELLNSEANPRLMWRSLGKLLHSRPPQKYSDEDCKSLVDTFNTHFTSKINNIRQNISTALSGRTFPCFPPRAYHGSVLSSFPVVSTIEVIRIISSLPNKSSPLDDIPTSLLKRYASLLAPVVAKLANISFTSGTFPAPYKVAQVLPLLKKANLDPSVPGNYRPISNLSTISKVLERLTLSRIHPHITSSTNFSKFQSAYRPGFSTETALLQISDGLLNCCGNQSCAIMVGLDLSAAFDTIDHQLLLGRLQSEFGIDGLILSWIHSYLSGRSQFVKLGNHASPPVDLHVGVPQGSVLGPLLFTSYTTPISDIVQQFGMSFHQYADDTSIFTSVDSINISLQLKKLESCSNAIRDWHLVNFLQLNPQKSEVMVLGTRQQLSKLPPLPSINIAGSHLQTTSALKLLGFTFDPNLSCREQVKSIVKSCNSLLWSIRHVRQSLTENAASALARCLVLTRLDYCNALLHGASEGLINSLQRVQNRLAKIVLNRPISSSSSECLVDLHWLPVRYRIRFKIAVSTFKILNTGVPSYLSRLIIRRGTTGRPLRSSSCVHLIQPVNRSTLANRSFRFAAPAIWNKLPSTIRLQPTLKLFKTGLKTHLFEELLRDDILRRP